MSVIRAIQLFSRHSTLQQVVPACTHYLARAHKHDVVDRRETCHVHDSTCDQKSTLPNYIDGSDQETSYIIARDLLVLQDYISEEEEQSLVAEVDPYMKRLRYESQHWDGVSCTL